MWTADLGGQALFGERAFQRNESAASIGRRLGHSRCEIRRVRAGVLVVGDIPLCLEEAEKFRIEIKACFGRRWETINMAAIPRFHWRASSSLSTLHVLLDHRDA